MSQAVTDRSADAPTDNQLDLLASLDDANEHLHFEVDPDRYRGVSTCGFASIVDVDGRKSFVRRLKGLAESDNPHAYEDRNGGLIVEIADFKLSVREDSYRGGYRISIVGQGILGGADTQRMDFQERIHDEFLRRMRQNGYLHEARRTSRMD